MCLLQEQRCVLSWVLTKLSAGYLCLRGQGDNPRQQIHMLDKHANRHECTDTSRLTVRAPEGQKKALLGPSELP